MDGPDNLIDDWRSWPFDLRARPTVTDTLPSETNAAYRLASSAGPLVLRVNSPNAPGVDRAQEALVLARVAGASFFDCTVHNSPGRGYLVMQSVSGEHPRDRPGNIDLERLGHAIAELQRLPASELSVIAPGALAESYVARLDAPRRSALALTLERLRGYDEGMWAPVLCHFDLLPPNLIVSEGRWTFLDWEFAAAGDRLIDIATLVEVWGLEGDAAAALLGGYGEQVERTSLLIMRARLRMLWFAWRLSWHRQVVGFEGEIAAIGALLDTADAFG